MQKLRTACDSCQASKVKCSRAKPSCWRCIQNGQPCVYSPYRRTGRPPKSITTPGTSLRNSREERIRKGGIRHQSKMSEDQNNETWQTQGESQQQNEEHTSTWSPVQLSSDSDLHGIYQSGSMVSDARMAESTDIAPTHALTASFDIREFDNHGLEDFEPTINFGGSKISRTLADTNFHPSIDDFRDMEWNWNVIADGPSPPQGPMPFLEGVSMSQNNEFTPQIGHNHSNTVINNHLLTAPSSVSSSVFTQQHLTLPDLATPENASPGSVPFVNRLCLGCKNRCYKSLSQTLAQITGQSEGGIALDQLLGLDRDLQCAAKKALACRNCMEKSNNQTIIMLVIMALDNLLGLFEKEQDVAQTSVSELPSWPIVATRCASSSATKQEGESPRISPQFPCTSKSLSIGKFTVDDSIKAFFLRQAVLSYIDNLGSTLSELEREVDTVLKNLSRKTARDMIIDICRRAFFL